LNETGLLPLTPCFSGILATESYLNVYSIVFAAEILRMNLFGNGRKHISSEGLVTLSIVTVITLASTVIMLLLTSPEFSWDEAFRLPRAADTWRNLWARYGRPGDYHGPMEIYLAKLGQQMLPGWAVSFEVRSRLLAALISSMAIGFLYWTLKHTFGTSRAAALVGCSLLLFNVIRLEETYVIGPHDLMLACTLMIAGLGYQWRDKPTLQGAIGLGAVMAFGVLSMTYVIPVAICWATAMSLTGRNWIAWDRTHLKVSWAIPIMLATTLVIVVALWPAGVIKNFFLRDFWFYLHFPSWPTLVGDHILEVTPRWAAAYWLAYLDAPILVTSIAIISIAMWSAFRNGLLSSKHAYLLIFLTFFLASALTAHLGGARNLLQLIAVLCLATGALFDEALGDNVQLIRFTSVVVGIVAASNLIWFSQESSYVPYIATDGYRAFLKENESRLREKTHAFVYGSPVLNYYAKQTGASLAWDVDEMPWTTRADAPLPADVKYVLIPAFVYDYMPEEQPMRRVVAEHWKVTWSFKPDHVWELRLYERP
jgi:hypothetical protein